MPVVGIDLGTTSSSVSISRNGLVELLNVEQMNRVMPSCVAFDGKESLVGEIARAQLLDNPRNTICDVKTMIGLTYDEAHELRNWGFDLEDVCKKPKIVVQCGEERKRFYPEEIAAMILSRIWENTKTVLGKELNGAVITVPASFNHAQRKATMDAATIAGVNVLGLINEPTAAALAYQYENMSTTERKMLILHFGGGSFNVSVVIFDGLKLHVKSSIGSSHIGGMNIDDRLFKHFADKFATKTGHNIRENGRSACLLRLACQKAKKNLISVESTRVEVPALFKGIDFDLSINWKKFRQINKSTFGAIEKSVQRVIQNAKLKPEQISDVLTIGNSARLPLIEEILTKHCKLDRKKIRKTIKPDEAAVSGAALAAEMIADRQSDPENLQRKIQDILTNTIALEHGGVSEIFSSGINIPSEKKNVTLRSELKVMSHEHAIANQDPLRRGKRLMGEITLSSDKSEANRTFSVNIDSSGLLKIIDQAETTVSMVNCGVPAKDIKKLIKDRKLHYNEDEDIRRRKNDLYELDREVYKMQDKYGCDLSHFVEWIKNTSDPPSPDIRRKRDELEKLKLEKQNQLRGSEMPEEDLKYPFKSKVSNENLMMKVTELLQELGILDMASDAQTLPGSNTESESVTDDVKSKTKPGAAKPGQVVNTALTNDEGVETRQKHKAAQSKKTATTKNTEKLDRETEEKKRALKKRADNKQRPNTKDIFQKFSKAHEEIRKLREKNFAVWKKREQILEIITTTSFVSTFPEKKEEAIMIPTKENKIIMKLLDLLTDLGIITDIQVLPGDKDRGAGKKSAYCEQEEKINKSFEEKIFILLEKARAEIKRLRMENNKLEKSYKKIAEELRNHRQTPATKGRHDDALTVSNASQTDYNKLESSNNNEMSEVPQRHCQTSALGERDKDAPAVAKIPQAGNKETENNNCTQL